MSNTPEAAGTAPDAADSLTAALSGVNVTEDEVLTLNLSVPACLNTPEAEGAPWVVEAYSKNCLNCDALVPSAELDGSSAPCHVSNGNSSCPAGSISIVFIGPRKKLLNQVLAAQESQDPIQVLEAMAKLGDKKVDPEDRAWVMTQAGILRS